MWKAEHHLVEFPVDCYHYSPGSPAEQLENMISVYGRRSEYHPDKEKLRDLLSKVTDEQKLNILQQTKIGRDRTALHEAAYRDDVEMIAIILSSLQSEDRLKLLMMRIERCTPLHAAAVWGGHKESVKAVLNSLTADQQMQLLAVEGGRVGQTAVERASGETADVLSVYKNNAREKAGPGEFIPHVM